MTPSAAPGTQHGRPADPHHERATDLAVALERLTVVADAADHLVEHDTDERDRDAIARVLQDHELTISDLRRILADRAPGTEGHAGGAVEIGTDIDSATATPQIHADGRVCRVVFDHTDRAPGDPSDAERLLVTHHRGGAAPEALTFWARSDEDAWMHQDGTSLDAEAWHATVHVTGAPLDQLRAAIVGASTGDRLAATMRILRFLDEVEGGAGATAPRGEIAEYRSERGAVTLTLADLRAVLGGRA